MLYRNYVEEDLDTALVVRENGSMDKEEDRLLFIDRILQKDTIITEIVLQVENESDLELVRKYVKQLYYKSDITYKEYDKINSILNVIYFTVGKITFYIKETN